MARKSPHPEIWVLADDKAGHRNQAIGVAEALGIPFTIKSIAYDARGRWPNILKGASLLGVDTGKSDRLGPPWPDLIIAAGRKTAPVARYVRKQARSAGKRCLLVQLMWPGFPAWGFDLIAAPEHDLPPRRRNVVAPAGAPHRVTSELLAHEGEMWRKTLGNPPAPKLALLVGGSAGNILFTPDHARRLGSAVAELTKRLGGSLMVTTSRRTGETATQALREAIAGAPAHIHDGASAARANPYYAFLALSDAIFVTGDSLSMCSEACASGKPVFIFAPEDMGIPEKHRRLHQSLFAGGFARPLPADISAAPDDIAALLRAAPRPWLSLPSAAEQVAAEIRRRFNGIAPTE